MHHKKQRDMAWGLEFTIWQTTWLNPDGLLKVRSTYQLPQVQTNFNHSLSAKEIKPRSFYKDVELGDIDYYGWICIEIVLMCSLSNNPDIGIQYLNEKFNITVYRKWKRRLVAKGYRYRIRKEDW